MMHRTRTFLVAVATGLALIVLTATPSAATLGTATAGTATINLTPVANLDLAPGGTAACSSAASTTIDVTMTTATAGTATINVLTSRFVVFGAGSESFLRVSGTGTVTISGGTMTVHANVAGNLYGETTPGSCVPDLSAPKCGGGNAVFMPSLTLSGTWTGTVTPPALSGTATLSGSRAMSVFGCTSPYTALNSRTLAVSNLTVPF